MRSPSSSVRCISWSEQAAFGFPVNEIDNSDNPYRTPEALGASADEAQAPQLDSPEALEALKHIKNGSTAGFIVAGITALMATVAVLIGGGPEALGGIDGTAFIDVALIAALAIGVRRRSRFAAVVLFAYFVLAKIYAVATTGNATGLIVTLLIAYYLARAVQGTFAYARLQREAAPNYRSRMSLFGKVSIAVAIPVGLLLVLGGAQLAGEAGGWVAPTRVLESNEVTEEVRAQLVESGILNADERVEYFYCDGLTFTDSGAILSDQGVTRYFTDELGELQVYGLPLDQIARVEKLEDGSFFQDSVYRVEGIDPESWFQLALPVENDQDEMFVGKIREAIGGRN